MDLKSYRMWFIRADKTVLALGVKAWDSGEEGHFIYVLFYCCIDGICSNILMSVYAVSI